MKKGTFLVGMAMGAVAGAGLEMAMMSRKGQMKRKAARTMQAMGTAMDSAANTMDSLANNIKK